MSTYFMLIDIVEPILNAIKLPIVSSDTKQALNNMIMHIKSIQISNIRSHTTRISLREQVPRCELLITSSFVPDHIRKFIDKESKFYVTYEYVYKGREFKIIMVYGDENVERKKAIVIDMFKWLTMIVDMGSLPRNCGKTTSIYCYLTPFKKELPSKSGKILSYDNANSAVTRPCFSSNEICVFREEELFKVFIHETFHAFNLDFSLHMNDNHTKQMKKMFNIKSEFNIYETYAETWAEIMNILFLSECAGINYANKILQAEVAFSLHQMNKVLAHMGLDYYDLIDTNGLQDKYKEETNVFCYYVLKSLVLFYWSDFVDFCDGSFKYKGTVNDFIGFIREKYNKKEFVNAANIAAEHVSGKTMRMTLWEN
jgi:hypothetical protein